MTIQYADDNDDGKADYPYVHLNLDYDSGYANVFARFSNHNSLQDKTWKQVDTPTNQYTEDWVLTAGNGTKTVYWQIKHTFHSSPVFSATVELGEIGMPHFFDYAINVTGAATQAAWVDFYIDYIHVKDTSGDSDVEFFLRHWVDNGAGSALSPTYRSPRLHYLHYNLHPDEDYYGDGYGEIYLGNVPANCLGIEGWGYGLAWAPPWDERLVQRVLVYPGQTVRLRTWAYDYDPWPLSNDYLGTVWTDTYTVPEVPGEHVLCNRWFTKKADGTTTNSYYEIKVRIVATVAIHPWGFYYEGSSHVSYGGQRELVHVSPEEAPEGTTEWYANIEDPTIGYEMIDPALWAWTKSTRPEMVVIGLSPVDLVVVDPDDMIVGTSGGWEEMFMVLKGEVIFFNYYVTETFGNVPGASAGQIDVNGDGIKDTVIVFDSRKLGEYEIYAKPLPPTPTEPGPTPVATSTYSIGIFWVQHGELILPPPQPQYLIPVQNALASSTLSEPYKLLSGYENGIYKVSFQPIADAGGPYWATEGNAINFTAGGSTDPDGDSLTYRWDFEDDGTWDTDWSSSPTASYTWNDDWRGTVRVEVSDGTFTDNSTATVTVHNAVPTVNAGSDLLAAPNEELTFSGSFTDQGVADTWTVSWDFGDGRIVNDTLTPTHVYSEGKKYTVTLTVTDDDGGVGIDMLTVNTGVEVSIDPIWAAVFPGESVVYNVLIHHLGNSEDIYDLELSEVAAEWGSLSTTSVTLGPDQSESVTLTVSPPSTARPRSLYGELRRRAHEFTIVATSQADPSIMGAVESAVLVRTGRTIESCDSTGAKQDTFSIPDEAYVMGSGYSPNTAYDIYVVEDVVAWSDGMVIPSRVPGTAASVSSDTDGNIPATLVWSAPLVPGKYDVVVDVNADGAYDVDVDALDDSDIQVTAGFFVIPEVPLGTIMATATMVIGLLAYIAVPRWRNKRRYVNP